MLDFHFHLWQLMIMKILLITLALILLTAQTASAPRGAWYYKVRIIERPTGTELVDVWYWRTFKEVE